MAAKFGKFWFVALTALPLIAVETPAMAQQQGTGWVDPDSLPLTTSVTEDGWSEAELAQLLAPIALYPDQLLAQVLTASTYPLEVVEADRWVRNQQNAALKGADLERQLNDLDWSPSVKSLVPFPEVLHMMSEKIDWMEDLGEAFLAEEGEVMAMVQQLRHEAAEAGTLHSTDQQVVRRQDDHLLIVPANPEVVYVPYYDPSYAYGSWGYPGYDPYFFGGPAYVGRPGMYFGGSSIVLSAFWGWSDWDWRDRRLRIHQDRYNRINYRRPPMVSNVWIHDPYHRRGVNYHNPRVRDRFSRSDGRPDSRWVNRNQKSNAAWRQDRDRSPDWNRLRERNRELDNSSRRKPDMQTSPNRGQNYNFGGQDRGGNIREQRPPTWRQRGSEAPAATPVTAPTQVTPGAVPQSPRRGPSVGQGRAPGQGQAPGGFTEERRARMMEAMRERQQTIRAQRQPQQTSSPAAVQPQQQAPQQQIRQRQERQAQPEYQKRQPRPQQARPERPARVEGGNRGGERGGNWRERMRPN